MGLIEKEEYLQSYEMAKADLLVCEERLKEVRVGIIIPSKANSGMPGGGGTGDLSKYMILIENEEKRYLRKRYRCVKLCAEISNKIERQEDEKEKMILMLRYIRLKSWKEIEEKMNYTRQHLDRLHKSAIKNFKM